MTRFIRPAGEPGVIVGALLIGLPLVAWVLVLAGVAS
jgi:hypothetical protein